MATSLSYGIVLEEWKEGRAVLAMFDGYLNDLRKYGFTFLAALLAADSIQNILKLEENARFAMILITIVFIIALRLIDKNYEQFQNATVIRAMILERILNIELTETISDRYRRNRTSWYIQGLYISFVFVAGGIGYIILPVSYQPNIIGMTVVGIVIICVLLKILNLILRHGDLPEEDDWFESKEVVCKIKDEEGNLVKNVEAENTISIPGYENHSWLWDTTQANPDKIYRVWPRDWNVPLRRSIIVYKPKLIDKSAQSKITIT